MANKLVLRMLTALLMIGIAALTPAAAYADYTILVPLVAAGADGTAAPAAALPATVVYNMYATDGYVTLADGTVSYNYGFVGGRQGVPLSYLDSAGNLQTLPGGAPAPTSGPIVGDEALLAGNAQLPGPVIYARVGDVVQINLKNLGVANPNAPNDPHSIHLHGLDVDAANDGVPETSIGAVPANSEDPGAGNIVVYMFTATYPGSYIYHCHQEADIHVQMGMYGALVIYNAKDPAGINGPGTGPGELWGFKYDRDYILLLSEFDMEGHYAEEWAEDPVNAMDWNWAYFEPEYWFINGLGFPNTIHAGASFNWTNWIAAHPGYDPFIVGSVGKKSYAGSTGEKILLRMINIGFQAQPMHMHGFHGKVIGSDQRAWDWSNKSAPGTGLEKNTLLIGSGETYEWLIDFGTQTLAGTYPAGTESRYNANGPSLNTNTADPAIPDLFSDEGLGLPGATFVGGPVVGPGVGDELSTPGQLAGATIQGQLFPFHNHDDYKATNNGAYPGGMFTMIMTVP